MEEKLEYTTIINNQSVVVTRYQPSNGKGLYSGKKIGIRKKVKKAPVDEQLHALNQLLLIAKNKDDDNAAELIQASIDIRLNKLIAK